MLSIQFIRENSQAVKKAMQNRLSDAPIDLILELDEKRRFQTSCIDDLRRRRKEIAKEGTASAIEEGRVLRDELKTLEDEVRQTEETLDNLLLQVPNMPDISAPVGQSEDDNIVTYTALEHMPKFGFAPKKHWDIGEALDIIDFERGVKLSGTRFYVLKGAGAALQRALINFFLDKHIRAHGYKEIFPPFMVHKECAYSSGNLPKFADNLYHDAEEDYWFVPTAEMPLTNLHRNEVLTLEQLPINYTAHTSCFRREKMSAGKETRGIKRGHQFEKVEMYKFCTPETSFEELDRILADGEAVIKDLKLPYRIKSICTADMGFCSTRSFDLEIYAAGQDEWLEVSSCSNCKDFQARRANIRFKRDGESKPEYVHTLNGSGLALPRVIIAILENYQQVNGTVLVPEVLQPYMNTDIIS